MNKNAIKDFSIWARNELLSRVSQRAFEYGITKEQIEEVKGDTVKGIVLSAEEKKQRNALVSEIKRKGFDQAMEEVAYTWFNRFIALRFMEVNEYLPQKVRPFTDEENKFNPQIIAEALDLDFVDKNIVYSYKDRNDTDGLYKYLLISLCNDMHQYIPGMFETLDNYMSLLFPGNLLDKSSVLGRLIADIDEDSWKDQVEIIGWLYQFYISDRKDAVYKEKKTITKDTLPAVTQLFTPDWIVRYMAENSVGRIWMESYPSSSLRKQMKYYVDEAEQPAEVQRKLEEIKYKNVNPEDIKIIEPCCGSGHILVYVFDLLYKMYEEKGYQAREIPTLILSNNIIGLDVDKRAAQLSSFALIMKARSVNKRFFSDRYYVNPKVYEIVDSNHLIQMQYKKHLSDLKLLNDKEIEQVDALVNLFKNGKTIGSLLKVKSIDFDALDNTIDKIEKESTPDIFNAEFVVDGVRELHYLSNIAKILSNKYDVMITNPPYIGISSMEAHVKEYASKKYPNSKADMLAMFMETDFVKKYGFMAMINMHSWMFLSSYETLREVLLHDRILITMAHLGTRAFESIGGEIVQTTTFVFRKTYINGYKGLYARLVDEPSQAGKEKMFISGNKRMVTCQDDYYKIPGSPFAYWTSQKILSLFMKGEPVSTYVNTKDGLTTSDNEKYIRYFWEVSFNNIGFNAVDEQDFWGKGKRFAPLIKGGSYRKWYGNTVFIITFSPQDRNVLSTVGNHLPSEDVYFSPYMTWNRISTRMGFRYCDCGFIFESASLIATGNKKDILYTIAFANSSLAEYEMKLINPTTNMLTGYVNQLRIPIGNDKNTIVSLSDQCIKASKIDWDSFETSWDFKVHPLIRWSKELWDATAISATMHHYYGDHSNFNSPLELCYMLWQGECKERFTELKNNEEELNKIFIDIYGLQDELTPEIEDKDITVRLADRERDIKSLISYAVGCIFGRYSLNTEGLAYAGGEWDNSKYRTFIPDKDNIIPISDDEYFEDDIVGRFIEFIKAVYGEDSLEDNLQFIADSLGGKGTSREVIRSYFINEFYNDHLKTYQKRPIYWQFDSGKKNGFKALVYLHRYTPDLLARIRTDYVHEIQERYRTQIDNLESMIPYLNGADKTKANKQLAKYKGQLEEISTFEEKLHHLADQMISIDLDDGVKQNYSKFTSILTKLK